MPPPQPAASRIVHFATNRARLSIGFDEFSPAPPDGRQLWLGRIAMQSLDAPGDTEASRHPIAPPEITGIDDFADPAKGSAARVLDAWLRDAHDQGAIALFFIHGFSNSFNSAVGRAAQIAEFYAGAGVPLVPLAFSWPSDGRVINPQMLGLGLGGVVRQYQADQQDAKLSGPALARLIVEIRRARDRAVKARRGVRMVLLAHSMGNLALASALGAMQNGMLTAALDSTFDHALLVASDVPDTALDRHQPLRGIALLAAGVTVVIAKDGMLAFASPVANEEKRRLGHFGPNDLAGLPDRIRVVDFVAGLQTEAEKPQLQTANATTWDTVYHQYYRNDLSARGDLAEVLGDVACTRRDEPAFGGIVLEGRSRHASLRPLAPGAIA
jgi:esterase/lipase superfamily enzyme